MRKEIIAGILILVFASWMTAEVVRSKMIRGELDSASLFSPGSSEIEGDGGDKAEDAEAQVTSEEVNTSFDTDRVSAIYLAVNGRKMSVTLENNRSAAALVEKLEADGLIIIHAKEYGGFEKVGELPFSLPTQDTRIDVVPGDVILYQGDKITLYYDKNNWVFTKLGHIEISGEELRELLGEGDVEMRLMME